MSKHRDIKLSLQKEGKLFAVKTKSSYYEVFDAKVISNRNEKKNKKKNKKKQTKQNKKKTKKNKCL